jgi:hypothetical protein
MHIIMIIILFFIIKVLPQDITQKTQKHKYIKYVTNHKLKHVNIAKVNHIK